MENIETSTTELDGLTTTNEYDLLSTTASDDEEYVSHTIDHETNKIDFTSKSSTVVATESPIKTTSMSKNEQNNFKNKNETFKYDRGKIYENFNIQQLWNSKFFEQKLSTRMISNKEPSAIYYTNPTTTSTYTTTFIPTTISSSISTSSISPTTTTTVATTTTTKFSLKNLTTGAFAVTFNLMKSNEIKNQTSSFTTISKIIQSINIKENLTDNYNVSNKYRTLSTHKFENSFVQGGNCNCNKTYNSSFFDEYTNVWKLSFFILAFVIGFVSLFLLLSLVLKVLIMHLRKFNLFGFRTYKLQNPKSHETSKVSSISLFDADSDNYLSNDCKRGKSGKPTKDKKKQKGKTKKPSRRKLINNNGTKIKVKSERIMYGVANKAFTEANNKYKEHREYMLPFDMTSNNGLFSSFVKEDTHSSFRPFPKTPNNNISSNRSVTSHQTSETNCVSISLSEIDLKNNQKITDIKEVSIIKRDDYPTYQAPWKCNDYEALETTTATGSVTNLSSITSLSEALNKQNSTFVHQQHIKIEKHNNNNNELISKCSKITEELEMKLKERRLLTEGDNCEATEKQNSKSINDKKETNLNERHQKNECSCPCHCHHDNSNNNNNNKRKQNQTTKSKKSKNMNNLNNQTNNKQNQNYQHRQIVNSEENIHTTDENSPTFTPSKRESIRKLMENKAVSENKQKHELEKHLTSMLISRINSCEIVE